MAKPKKFNASARKFALECVALYVIDCTNKDYEDYLTYCSDNNLNPKDIGENAQLEHVYAKALIGLGLEFPKD